MLYPWTQGIDLGSVVLTRTHGIAMDSWYRPRLTALTTTHGIENNSWYWQQLMELTMTQGIELESWYSTKTHGIDMDSWYWHRLMVLTCTHGIDNNSWYWLGLYSWITHIQECCPYAELFCHAEYFLRFCCMQIFPK